MSGPQPGYVQPNPIPQRLSPEPDITGPQAGLQRGWSDMSGPRPGHVLVSDTPMARFLWGLQKVFHASLARLATHFTLQTPSPRRALSFKWGFGTLIRGMVSSILYSNPPMDYLPVRLNPKPVLL
jgi:hypothetical protein